LEILKVVGQNVLQSNIYLQMVDVILVVLVECEMMTKILIETQRDVKIYVVNDEPIGQKDLENIIVVVVQVVVLQPMLMQVIVKNVKKIQRTVRRLVAIVFVIMKWIEYNLFMKYNIGDGNVSYIFYLNKKYGNVYFF
jgi:hypothetical protein